jgi:uncharacterized membrane protein HdeD (DUF308 family)
MTTLSYNLAFSQVQRTLRVTYGIVPIVAGIDKFTELLVNWENYIHPGIVSMLPFSPHTFMMIVGVIEIIAGIIVLAKPAIGGFIVMAWLGLIAITLLASGNYLDVAVRDLTMAIGALSLARLSKIAVPQDA